MFFVLSKTLDFLLMPLTIIFMVLVAAAVLKTPRIKKILLWAAIIMLYFFSNDFVANELMLAWEIKATRFDEVSHHELGIVLTGATQSIEPDDRVYFTKGADRVTHTVQLYKLGLIKKILISGGTGLIRKRNSIEPEADKFQKVMLLMGVPERDIILENDTRNTHESAVRVKPMLDSLNLRQDQCILITSAFHMRRTLACYHKVGLDIEPFTTDFYAHQPYYYPDAFLEPRVESLVIWNKLFKEWLGFVAYKLAGYV